MAVDPVFAEPRAFSTGAVWLATLAYAVQIYCDFSGYSDIALGSAQVMGFKLMKNFRQPYWSRSITEFWRRWHISLSTWFKDYLYIPLGGNRVSEGRRYLKQETVALMTSDQIGPETNIARDQFYFPGEGSGYGLGFAVRVSVPRGRPWPIGEFRWDGVGGTFFFIDPKDDMFAICMMQSPSQRERIQTELKTLIYQALSK